MIPKDDIRRQVGQLFLVGFDGYSVPESYKAAMSEFHIGGTIYFKRNVESPAQLAELSNELQFQCRPKDAPGFLISIDHEGGKVNRLPKPFTKFPGIDYLGEMGSPRVAFQFGLVHGRELTAVGINVNFAPVVDVLTNPNNPVMKNRTFSSDPEVCAKLGSAVCRGLQKAGVAAVAKHFPGHGDTSEDSHLTLPVVKKSLAEMETCEFVPFKRMIRSRVEGMMTAHLINQGIDPENPSTLSKKTMDGILRGQLRFSKVIFTDDMEMKAVSANYGPEEAAVMAIEAGCDILIYRGDPGFPVSCYEAILKAVESGRISRERLSLSVQRILALKKGYCRTSAPVDVTQISQHIGLPEHLELADTITRKEIPKNLAGDSDSEG